TSTNTLINDLINTQNISPANHSEVQTQLGLLNDQYLDTLDSMSALAFDNLQVARQSYYDALIATGVDPAIPSIDTALTAYNAAQTTESSEVNAVVDGINNTVTPHYNNFYSSSNDLLN